MPKSMSKRLLLVLVICCGCGWLVKPAEVELVEMTFPSENIVDLAVLIHNRNPFSVKVSGLEYQVRIGAEVVGRGQAPGVLLFRGRDSLQTHFPVKYDAAALVRALPQIMQDTVVVRIDGTYRLQSLLSKPKMPFSAERRIAVKDRLGGILKSLLGGQQGNGK
jgi:LEA14-like dessication related protein